jgi:hypothetical protein
MDFAAVLSGPLLLTVLKFECHSSETFLAALTYGGNCIELHLIIPKWRSVESFLLLIITTGIKATHNLHIICTKRA